MRANVAPKKGSKKLHYGIKWIHNGTCWEPDGLLTNLICKKNAGHGRLYGAHPRVR